MPDFHALPLFTHSIFTSSVHSHLFAAAVHRSDLRRNGIMAPSGKNKQTLPLYIPRDVFDILQPLTSSPTYASQIKALSSLPSPLPSHLYLPLLELALTDSKPHKFRRQAYRLLTATHKSSTPANTITAHVSIIQGALMPLSITSLPLINAMLTYEPLRSDITSTSVDGEAAPARALSLLASSLSHSSTNHPHGIACLSDSLSSILTLLTLQSPPPAPLNLASCLLSILAEQEGQKETCFKTGVILAHLPSDSGEQVRACELRRSSR